VRVSHTRTFVEHTLLNLLALTKIDKGFDERETANDFLTQRNELLSCFALKKKTSQVKVKSQS
jgi:hypothetical protein